VRQTHRSAHCDHLEKVAALDPAATARLAGTLLNLGLDLDFGRAFGFVAHRIAPIMVEVLGLLPFPGEVKSPEKRASRLLAGNHPGNTFD
jgi:hypothetical protein